MRYKEEVSSFQPPTPAPIPPPFYVFYDAPLPNKLLRCLESIRSNIPLLKTSWLFLEGRRVKRDGGGTAGRGQARISSSIESRAVGE